MGRRGIGAEIKRSYFDQAVANLREAERNVGSRDLFAAIDAEG